MLLRVTASLLVLGALIVVVLAVLWRVKPTKFRLTLKLWKLVHLELESESRTLI